MTIQERISAFSRLGAVLSGSGSDLQDAKDAALRRNAWFTEDNIDRAVRAWADLLQQDTLERWLEPYGFGPTVDKTVGLVCAGNVPMVGFHDMLAVLAAGFRLKVKFSTDDAVLNQFALDRLCQLEPRFVKQIEIVEQLSGFDLVIATGSNNTARYFHHYFGKYPHIIRQNRNSVAVLDGRETKEELFELGKDIFSNFGLGCRNVSKIYVPSGYDVSVFFGGIAGHEAVGDHYKYNNNYDFNKSIYLINGDKHFDNGFLLLKPDQRLSSPLAVLYYEEYDSEASLGDRLADQVDTIQCLVGRAPDSLTDFPQVEFGKSQFPGLDDFADRVDTLAFLAEYRT